MRFNNITLAAATALTIAGCGCGGNQTTTTVSDMNNATSMGAQQNKGGGQKVGKHLTVGVVFDSGGRGDKSFNDSAFAGTEMAKKVCNVDIKPVDSRTPKDYETNLTNLAEGGCDLVFAIGISQNKAVEAVAEKYPNVKFAIVDAVVDKPNVRSLVFAEEQGSYLAGYLAGLSTKSNKIGFVGGMEIPLIKKFEYGFQAGAHAANPKAEMLPAKFTASWDDIDKGKAAANVLFDGGADIVYHAAGRCGIGVINAAKEKNKFAIGVDSDQDDVAKGNVLTSMIKHVDQAVLGTIKDMAMEQFTPGTKVYDLKSNGVGLSEMKYTLKTIGKDKIAKVNAQADLIKAGKLRVPTTEEQYTQFLTDGGKVAQVAPSPIGKDAAKAPAKGAAPAKPTAVKKPSGL